MATPTPIDVPTLTWSRAPGNRIKIWLLGVLTVVVLAPFVVGVSYMIASVFFHPVNPAAVNRRSEIAREENTLRAATNMDSETRKDWERILQDKRASIDSSLSSRISLTDLVVLLSAVQAAGLALLFWSIASSPTAKLLVEAGAAPAGPSEKEARQILESVARAAGLPPPKLYIIESNTPNAFAAGAGPQQSVVAVSRGLLALLNAEELEGVLAHEISHIGNEDILLNSVVAAIALFLRIPYLLFRRELQAGKRSEVKRRRNPWRIALSPVGLYIVFVAPVLGAAIRAAVSRKREFFADADALELTGSPRGLLRALSKIGGSGSALPDSNPAFAHFYFASPSTSRGWFGGNMMATHPPMAERIQRLATIPGAPSIEVLKDAIEDGRRYTREHPPIDGANLAAGGSRDELSTFNRGNPMGRVYRLLSAHPAPLYETPSPQGPVLTRLKPGELIVVFDDPGKMRQVNTARQNFGYIERTVKLALIDGMIPAEVYDPVARAAAEAKLPPLAVALQAPDAQAPSQGLSFNQILAAAAFAVAVFAGMFFALMKFSR